MVRTSPKGQSIEYPFDREKLEEAILFFLDRANNGHLGKTKLMKLLYYADFDHAEQYGEPITGATYRKYPQGPVPVEASGVLDEMTRSGTIEVEERSSGPYTQFRFAALRHPNVQVFGDTELAILDDVVTRWEYVPLNSIVAATHAEAPWLAVGLHEDIPYHLAHYRRSLGARHLTVGAEPGRGLDESAIR